MHMCMLHAHVNMHICMCLTSTYSCQRSRVDSTRASSHVICGKAHNGTHTKFACYMWEGYMCMSCTCTCAYMYCTSRNETTGDTHECKFAGIESEGHAARALRATTLPRLRALRATTLPRLRVTAHSPSVHRADVRHDCVRLAVGGRGRRHSRRRRGW